MIRVTKYLSLIFLPTILLWGSYTLNYSLSDFTFHYENGFTRIDAKEYSVYRPPGEPELPSIFLNYIIPPNAKVESLIISQLHTTEIEGQRLIYPAQPLRSLGETLSWVPPDTLIYNSEEPYPGTILAIVDEGLMDGARIVTVQISPLQYQPKSKRLYLVDYISFDFAFKPSTFPELRPIKRGKFEQPIYDAALKSAVVNDNEIAAYYSKPILVEENQLGGFVPYPTAPCAIIAPAEFHNEFQRYADWLTDQGLRTCLISPQTIYFYFMGCDPAERIRNYIKHCYQYAGGTYFILGGDDYFLPVRYCVPLDIPPDPPPTVHDSIPCDLYFSDLTGDWNCDPFMPDAYWGEMTQDNPDRFPEVFVGRVSAYNVNEVENWVDKVLNYEISPANTGDELTTVSWIYNHDIGRGFSWGIFPEHFSHNILEDRDAYPDAFNEINNGYGLVTIDCHGDIREFHPRHDDDRTIIHSFWLGGHQYNNTGVNKLTNSDKYYICYSFSCYCGAFDKSDTCIADAFTDAYCRELSPSPVGASAYLGNTRYGKLYYVDVGPSHGLQANFYNNLFTKYYPESKDPSEYSRIGVAEALSKVIEQESWDLYEFRYVCYAHNLFGSPHTEAWTNEPGELSVFHRSTIPVGLQTQFRVIVRDGETSAPVPYAKVCLNKLNDIYEVQSTDCYGQTIFYITPSTTGTMNVTVTRGHNYGDYYIQYYPSRTICEVIIGPGGGQSSGSDHLLPTELSIVQISSISKTNLLLKYAIPDNGKLILSIYDASGKLVKSFKRKDLSAGYYEEKIDLRDLPAGIYFVILKQYTNRVVQKVVIVK